MGLAKTTRAAARFNTWILALSIAAMLVAACARGVSGTTLCGCCGVSMALAPAVEEPPPAEAGPGKPGRNNPDAAGTRFACASPAAIDTACNAVLFWIALIGGILLAAVVGSIVVYRRRVPPHRRGLATALRTEICWAVIPVLMLIGVATAALADL